MFKAQDILDSLKMTDDFIDWQGDSIEILVVGGAAAMLTGLLPSERLTQDCDIMSFMPADTRDIVLEAAKQTADIKGLPPQWLNDQVISLNVLPDGWRSRRCFIAEFGKLKVYAVSRLDLLAMKFYANRPQDREDILNIKPTQGELEYIGRYLNMLKLPRRRADLDQIQDALRLLEAVREMDIE
jgi:hypothetical protein